MINAIRKFFSGRWDRADSVDRKATPGKCECSGELAAIRTAVKNMEIKLNLWEMSLFTSKLPKHKLPPADP